MFSYAFDRLEVSAMWQILCRVKLGHTNIKATRYLDVLQQTISIL